MMNYRRQRVLGRELLDLASPEEAAGNLADLVRINRWFGGHAILRGLLRQSFGKRPFTALDVGAASGDMAQAAVNARVVCADRQVRNLNGAPHPKVAADALALPFADGTFDVVWCSLFLHHFSEEEAVRMLQEMRRVARHFVIAIDLRRNWFAYYFLPMTRRIFGWLPLTVHDGMASVQAGFTPAEFASLMDRAGFGAVRIRRHRLWQRLSAIAPVS